MAKRDKNITFSEIAKHYPYVIEPYNLDGDRQYRNFRYVVNQKFIHAARDHAYIEMIIPAPEMLAAPVITYHLLNNDPCHCSKLIFYKSEVPHHRCMNVVNEAEIIFANCARQPTYKTDNFYDGYEMYEHFVAVYQRWNDNLTASQLDHVKQINKDAWQFYVAYLKLSSSARLRFVTNESKELGLNVVAPFAQAAKTDPVEPVLQSQHSLSQLLVPISFPLERSGAVEQVNDITHQDLEKYVMGIMVANPAHEIHEYLDEAITSLTNMRSFLEKIKKCEKTANNLSIIVSSIRRAFDNADSAQQCLGAIYNSVSYKK